MPEANQFLFSNHELLELLIKQAGVHKGRWILMTNFGFSAANFAANFGAAEAQIAPGAAIVVNQMGIQLAPAGTPDSASLDAAVVNPEASKPSST
jgi:hypothetical protein